MMTEAQRAEADIYVTTFASERDENGRRLAGDCAGVVCLSENSASTEASAAATAMMWLFAPVQPSDRMTMPDRCRARPQAEIAAREGMT